VSDPGRLIDLDEVSVGPAKPAPIAVPAGRRKTFRSYDPDQVVLLAPVLRDWVPEGDLAHFVSDLIDAELLDLSAIYDAYGDARGFPPYDPRLMSKLLIYGYAIGITSSRKLEQATHRDVAVRMLCADQHPDYRAIARFRKRHLQALGDLFLQTLRLCEQAGLVQLGTLAVDGTKLRANASRRKAMSYQRMSQDEQRLKREIGRLLDDAERIDAEEDALYGADNRGDELPPELQNRQSRLKRLREAKAALEAEAKAAEEQRRSEMRADGRTPREPRDGRDPFAPRPTAQRNFTDPDSKIMKTADGAFHQCFNAQAIVDSAHQIVVATDLGITAPDYRYLPPILDRLDENLRRIGRPTTNKTRLLADAGYCSTENIETATAHQLDGYFATGRQKHHEPPGPAPRGRIPNASTLKDRMARKLKTKRGRAIYARRKVIIEPVFGQIQTVQNARQLRIRGTQAAAQQWDFTCAIHNLLKLHRNGGLGALQTG
jgi:transposase